MSQDPAEDKARVLLSEIEAALASGTQHFDKSGMLLQTPRDIVKALLNDGEIQFHPSTGRALEAE